MGKITKKAIHSEIRHMRPGDRKEVYGFEVSCSLLNHGTPAMVPCNVPLQSRRWTVHKAVKVHPDAKWNPEPGRLYDWSGTMAEAVNFMHRRLHHEH